MLSKLGAAIGCVLHFRLLTCYLFLGKNLLKLPMEPSPLVLRVSRATAGILRRVSTQMAVSLSDIVDASLRLRCVIGQVSTHSPVHTPSSATCLLKVHLRVGTAALARQRARLEGLAMGQLVAEGVQLHLISEGRKSPANGRRQRLPPGRRARSTELPIVIIDDQPLEYALEPVLVG